MTERMRPIKHWGQNFLRDTTVVASLLDNIAPTAQKTLIEIGPGQGALTSALLSKVKTLDVIEIDKNLASTLQQNFGTSIRIHTMDALAFDFASFQPGQDLQVVGNVPYNISTPLLFHLFMAIERISSIHFMLQREVAERLIATPGSKAYSSLSVVSQCFTQTHIVLEVPPQAFYPQPKVMSAFVAMRTLPLASALKDKTQRRRLFALVAP